MTDILQIRHIHLYVLLLAFTITQEAHIDEKNKVVSTPAYMCETALHEIFDGIGIMISNVLKMAK